MLKVAIVFTLILGIANASEAQSVPTIDAERRMGESLLREFETKVTLISDPLVSALVTRVGPDVNGR